MRPELWRQVEELFHAALEHSPDDRRAFLDSACGQDTELRRHVDLLVSAEENAGSFLDKAGVEDLTAGGVTPQQLFYAAEGITNSVIEFAGNDALKPPAAMG